jgi:hypothetical protein
MQHTVMLVIRRFVPQKVPVGAGVEKSFVTAARPFAHRKRYGAIIVPASDLRDNLAHQVVGTTGVFSSLKDEGTEAQIISSPAA